MNTTDSGETSEFDDRSYTPILTVSDNEPGPKNLNIFADKQAQFNGLAGIFAKQKSERTAEEVSKAIEALKTVPLFKKFVSKDPKNNEALMHIYEAMNYEVINKDDAVFHYGEKGSKVYLILKGSVDIFLPKDPEEVMNEVMGQRSQRERENREREGFRTGERKTSLKPERSTSRSRRESLFVENGRRHSIFKPEKTIKTLTSHTLNNIQDVSGSQGRLNTNSSGGHYPNNPEAFSKYSSHQELYFEEGVLKFKRLKTIYPGSYCGEIGLTSDAPRDSSAIAASNVCLVSLTKWAYEKTADLIQERMKSKWDFFSALLKEESKEIIKRFCSSFREEQRRYGQKIIQQGSMPKEVYIICQGEVQIIKHDVEKEKETESDTAKFLVDDKRKKKIVNKRVANLGRFAFVGEGEALLGQPYNMTALSMSNNTILYTTTVEEYAKLKRAYPYTFNNIDQAYQTKAAFWDKRITNLSQTQEKIYEELSTPPRRSKSPITGYLRNELDMSDRASPASDKIVKRQQISIQDNSNAASPYRMNTPAKLKDSKAFTFDSVYNELQGLHEDSFREKRYAKYTKNQMIRKPSSAQLRTGENTNFTDENDDITKKSHSKSKFSAVPDRSEFERTITPQRHTRMAASALEKLFKDKIFQDQQPPQRAVTSAKSIRSGKSLQSGMSLRFEVDSSSNNNKRVNKEAYLSVGSATKGEIGSLNDSRRDTSFLQFIDEKKHMRKSSFQNKNLPISPDDIQGTLENEIMTAAPRKPDIKLEDQSSQTKFIKLSKTRSAKTHSSGSEGYFLNPQPRSRGYQNTDLASLELGSPFSKKRIELSLTLNNFNVNRNHLASTKAEKIIEAIWPGSPLQVTGFQRPETLFTAPTTPSEKNLRPFQSNKTIIASKHNLFRLKPAKAHLAVNYSATGLTFKEGGRIKKY